jgi:hypothetical protein
VAAAGDECDVGVPPLSPAPGTKGRSPGGGPIGGQVCYFSPATRSKTSATTALTRVESNRQEAGKDVAPRGARQRLVARGSASLAHSLKMTAGFVGDPAFARGCSEHM